jgi:hypothetical protein
MKRKSASLSDQEKELKKCFGGILTAEDRNLFAAYSEQERRSLLDRLRAMRRPLFPHIPREPLLSDRWEQIRLAWDREEQRLRGIAVCNDERQQAAADRARQYEEENLRLIMDSPRLRRASKKHRAELIARELKKRGIKTSPRTIRRTLDAPKK